jgi:hypothetical protein
MLFFNSEVVGTAFMVDPSAGHSWTFADDTAWDRIAYNLTPGGQYTNADSFVLDCPVSITELFSLGATSHIQKELSSYLVPTKMMVGIETTADIGFPSMYALDGRASTAVEAGGWYFTQNCVWNASTNLWNQTNPAKGSSALGVTSSGFVLCRKAWGAVPWALTDWDHSSTLCEFADDKPGGAGAFFYSTANVKENDYEKINFAQHMYAPMAGTDSYLIKIPVNYRTRKDVEPVHAEITVENEEPAGITLEFTHRNEWGGYITATIPEDSYVEGDHFDVRGFLEVY